LFLVNQSKSSFSQTLVSLFFKGAPKTFLLLWKKVKTKLQNWKGKHLIIVKLIEENNIRQKVVETY